MRIFLTGATSLIGAAVAPALARAGHHVTALLRPTGPVPARLRQQGIDILTGDLSDVAANRSALEGYEALVHCARDTSPNGPAIDRQLIDAWRDVFWRAGSGLLLYASSAWVIGPTRGAVDESAATNPPEIERDRLTTEQAILESQGGGVRAVVVRPGLVYGGDSGIVSDMLRDAANGILRVVGSGDNHWPLVYRDDLVDLFVRLVAHAEASGVVHATDGSDDTVNDLVEAMSSHVVHKPEVRHMSMADARHRMGALAEALAMDQIVRSPKALAMGWTPSLTSASRNVPRLLEERRDQVMGAG
ncbi:MAG: NAD-dependent epimerase/dehydratase family protein [Vicinamibacteraceae bacterium]